MDHRLQAGLELQLDKQAQQEHDPFYRPPGFNLPPDAIERKPIPMPEPPGLPQRPDDWRDVMPRYPGLPKEQPTIGGKISSAYKDMLRKAQEFQKRNREKRYREYIQEQAPVKEPTPSEINKLRGVPASQGMPGLRDILRAPGKEPTPGETTQGMPGLRDILR